jgi:hypothetical protein
MKQQMVGGSRCTASQTLTIQKLQKISHSATLCYRRMLKYFKVNDEAVASGSRLDLMLKRIPCLERDKSLVHGVKAAVIMIHDSGSVQFA